jgi:hypothetical protein
MLSDTERNYRVAFASEAGQRVIEDLKLRLHHAQTLYANKQTTEELHYLMGRQSVINDILFILNKEDK